MGVKQVKILKTYEDKISDLPHEILVFILSFVTMKEAARTSILSSKWKYVWRTYVAYSSTLDLDVLAMRGSDYPKNMFGDCLDGNLLRTERQKFAAFVDHILQLDHCSVKDSFRLRFYLDNDFSHHIDQWIGVAITKRCQNLNIDFSHFHPGGDTDRDEKLYYRFPSLFSTQEIGSSVKSLCLKSCNLGLLDSNEFSSLVDIQLEHVLIDNDSMASILSNCPNLENSYLVSCRKLSILEVSGPSLRLKYLTIVFCNFLETIKTNAKHLSRLQYTGNPVKFMFLDVPQLSNVIIRTEGRDTCGPLSYALGKLSMNYALGKLSSDLPKLESLMLSVVPIEKEKIPRQLPLFANLKKLVLLVIKCGGTLWGFISLLQASPYLRRLELHLSVGGLESEEGQMEKPFDFPHLHLEEIMLSGYKGHPDVIEFATYLLENATTLKKMTISYDKIYYDYKSGSLNGKSKEKLESLASGSRQRKRKIYGARTKLVHALRPGVELLIA